MSVAATFELVSIGWCRYSLTVGSREVTTTGSYLSDALGGLACATVELVEGAKQSRFSFDEEPGEYRWVFQVSRDRVQIRVLWFEDLWSGKPDEAGKVEFDAECSLADYVDAIQTMLERTLSTYGLEGYRKQWVEHEFPVEILEELQRLASIDRPQS